MKKKIAIISLVVVLIVVLVGINFAKSKGAISFSKGKAIEVKTTKAKIGNMNATVSVNGVVEEATKEDIFIDNSVKVKDVYVEKNQYVKQGQKLFEFDMDDLNSQLNQAKVNLNIQNFNLQKIKDALKLQNTDQTQTSLNQAAASLQQAEDNYNRTQRLFNEGAVSKLELDNAKTQYDNATYQYNISQSNLNDLNKNNNDLTNSNQIDIKNQTEQIKLIQLNIQDLQSKINKLNSQSISPIDGVITDLNLQKGSITNPAVSAAKIISPEQLEVKLKVKEMDILKVKAGQNVDITGDAFPDKVFKGAVDSVGEVAQKETTMSNSDEAFVEVIVKINDTQNLLKPGLSVTADIITQTKNNVVITPFDTIQEDKDGNKWVFVVNGDAVKQVGIETGISSGLDLEVTKGLHGNEEIVKDPASRLKDGSIITINNAN